MLVGFLHPGCNLPFFLKHPGGVGHPGRSNDPGLGVIRHADAGYDIAKDYSRKHKLDLKERISIKQN